MARGTVVNEAVVSQASTEEFREGYERTFGERKAQRGRWIYDAARGKCVPADEYRAPERALDAPIIADRIHEGTTYDDGERRWDLGSRRRRREFMKTTGNVEASDYSADYREKAKASKERDADRRVESAFDQAARKLHNQGKIR